MVGVIIVAHGTLAKAFKEAIELITGTQENFVTVSIEAQDNVDKARQKLKDAIESVEEGEGVLILTDMFGGTPTNLSLSFLEEKKIEVLTGVNLPMLIKLVNLRMGSTNLEQLKEELCKCAREKIIVASDLLHQKRVQQG